MAALRAQLWSWVPGLGPAPAFYLVYMVTVATEYDGQIMAVVSKIAVAEYRDVYGAMLGATADVLARLVARSAAV